MSQAYPYTREKVDGAWNLTPANLGPAVKAAFPSDALQLRFTGTEVKIVLENAVDKPTLDNVVAAAKTAFDPLAVLKAKRKLEIDDKTVGLIAAISDLTDGIALKAQIDAAVDVAAVDAIVDNRTAAGETPIIFPRTGWAWFQTPDVNIFRVSYRVLVIGATSQYNFVARIPRDMGTLTKMVAVATYASAFGPAGVYNLFSSYGANTESLDNTLESDVLTGLSSPGGVFEEIDLMSVATSVAPGDTFGVTIDGDTGLQQVEYFGIYMEYDLL